ncbi:NADPH-dependent FMN reductase [Arthrobacter sulfonylureivorans]|uniref:NAD(P)H-dependent oxidoreductase n=1 Tax=Arthrobacter sulfonylureivorans TaxID=2486855 RepID=A0ABY3WHF6_9MICC|nr:NAD(P)H-dependent oxidoreductase [Arthrobacter sulfonylureivorans]UNK47119.1 NAD(P)H-dependent oxidoreductase [Arthrobacter sulfonylureivorans]
MQLGTLQVIICSTRPGRVGAKIGRWFAEFAQLDLTSKVEVVDLGQIDLPVLNEPEHPASGRYVHQHTKEWSAIVSRGDAFVFVIPEYNHSYNSAVKNAIDYLHVEWRNKAVGFVSYGGVSAGTRAVQALKPVFLSVKAVPVLESVNIPFVSTHFDANGSFVPSPQMCATAKSMIEELCRLDSLMQELRPAGT